MDDPARTEPLIGRNHALQKRAAATRAYASLLFGGRRSISPDNIAEAEIGRVRRAIRISVLLETVLVLLVSGSMLVFAYLASDSHRRVEADAMLASIDLTRAIGTEIDRNLASVKLAMEATVKALQIPNIWNTDPELRNAALFGSKDLVRGISTLAIIDRDARLIAHSLDLVAPDMRFDDRAYFVKAKEDVRPGILVTGPMFGRTTNKDVLLLSQRLVDANRHFAGVVTGSIYMSYFEEVCEPILLGRDDAIGIMYLDGTPILRLPKFSFSTYSNADEYDTRELVAHAETGAYIGRSRYDGISRLTAYEKFNDEQPLFLYYSRTTDSIFREWRRTYIATGLLLTVMWGTKIYTIVSLHRRRHRMAAEGLKAANRARMEALRASEARLQRAQHLAQMGSEVRDRRTGEVEWSDETFRIFGLSRDTADPSAETLSQLCHTDDREKVAAAEDQLRLGICPPPYECRIARGADGRHIRLEYEFTDDDDDEPRYVTGTIQDVTERRRTEALLHQAQKMEAIGTLTGGIAHDFNNLLGVMILNLSIAQRLLPDTDAMKTLVNDSLASARSGAELIRGLLAFARRQPMHPSRIDINQLVTTTTNLLSRVVREDIKVSLELAPDLWPVIVDRAQLEACLMNLATNARDAMPSGGRLTIATRNQHLDADYARMNSLDATGDFVVITVSDTGIGMTQDVIARAFEPFFTTKEPGKGTGLGLSMIFGFAKQSGGHVSIYSELGMGATIHLYLPRALDDAVSGVTSTTRSPLMEQGHGEIVLVVEDNAGMRAAVVRQLERLNYQILEADSAGSALALLEGGTVDVLFSDVVMPGGMNGFLLAERVRMRWPAIAVLLTSGFSGDQRDAWSDNAQQPRLLSKPFEMVQLANALREVLRGRGAGSKT